MRAKIVLGLFATALTLSCVKAVKLEASAHFPLQLVEDVPLPGATVRFDYQDLDLVHRQLVLTHMNDNAVTVVRLSDGAVVKRMTGIPTARGVVVAPELNRIFVTSSPNQLVVIDSSSLTEIARVATGAAPDGVAWDGTDQMVAVSDQHDGALSLLPDAGLGVRRQVPLGVETGNVVYDGPRARLWITVVRSSGPDQLVSVEPSGAIVERRFDVPGCSGAHGLRIHPDGLSALIACESNNVLARLDLNTGAVTTSPVGNGPDVLAIDAQSGWLYVAAESGDLTVFDLSRSGLVAIGAQHVADAAHSVAVDPTTHRVYFPLQVGPNGSPVLRIMAPK